MFLFVVEYSSENTKTNMFDFVYFDFRNPKKGS